MHQEKFKQSRFVYLQYLKTLTFQRTRIFPLTNKKCMKSTIIARLHTLRCFGFSLFLGLARHLNVLVWGRFLYTCLTVFSIIHQRLIGTMATETLIRKGLDLNLNWRQWGHPHLDSLGVRHGLVSQNRWTQPLRTYSVISLLSPFNCI